MTITRARMAAFARVTGRCCPETARVVGGHKTAAGRVDHVLCRGCGFYGDTWKYAGVIFNVPVALDVDGRRCVDAEAYSLRIAEITGRNWMRIVSARAEEER